MATKRFMELEGLRGLAAIAVALGHFTFLFFPAMRSGNMSLAHNRFEDNIYGTPLTFAVASNLAVAVFFVLSGFVLSISYFQKNDDAVVKRLAIDRYLRLMLPALASVMLAWVLISFGAGSLTSSAGEIANSRELGMKWRYSPGFLESIKTGTFDIFTQYRGQSRAINHVLWTMYVEFIGSFIVFAFLLMFARSKYRWIAYGVLTIGTLGTHFLGFVLGIMIADAYTKGWLEHLKRNWIRIPVGAAGLWLGLYPKGRGDSLYRHLELPFVDTNWRQFYLIISAALLILSVFLFGWVAALLRKPVISGLGRYTFSLYLTHLFVIYTVSCSIVIAFHESLGYSQSVLLAAVVSLPVFVLLSYLFERYVDAPSIRFSKYVGAIYRGEKRARQRDHRTPA